MKTSLAIAAVFLTLSACFLAPRARVVSPAPKTQSEDDTQPYPALTDDAPMQRLLVAINDAAQTETRLDRTHIADALEAIADAMESFTQHEPQAIESMRADVSALRKPIKARRQAELVRAALDDALVALRAHASARTFDDIERASGRIESVSSTVSLSRQSTALRDALCAVGNAVSARARLASLRCINARRAMADNVPQSAPGQALNTPQ